jgi:polysaccharide pyruvyl transferase WcaK-like protein
MKKNNILITGVGRHNFGAELMLRSVLYHAKRDVTFVVEPSANALPPEFYTSLGIRPLEILKIRGIRISSIFKLIPKRFRSLFGLVGLKEIDIVIDASGFAYSNQWGNQAFKSLRYYLKLNCNYVMLPQAFGPFEGIDRTNLELLKRVNIFSRDSVSYDHLKKIGVESTIAPDFTSVYVRNYADTIRDNSIQDYFAIVPNVRMLDKTDMAYKDFLVELAAHFKKLGQVIVIYQSQEDQVCFSDLLRDYNSVSPKNALEYIGVLDNAKVIFSSRYHGCAIGLALGKPVFCRGWSHKYLELYKEYGIERLMLNSIDELEILQSPLEMNLILKSITQHNEVLEHKISNLFETLI